MSGMMVKGSAHGARTVTARRGRSTEYDEPRPDAVLGLMQAVLFLPRREQMRWLAYNEAFVVRLREEIGRERRRSA